MAISVCVQAGGQSRRMGQNKALLSFMGKPLIQWVVERVAPLAGEIIVISNDPSAYEFLHLPVLPDQIPGKGVLGGLYTALYCSMHPLVVPVACDMPFINLALLKAECDLLSISHADVVIPASPNGLEPLHAVYRRETCLPVVRQALSQEQRRLIGWFDQVAVRVMEIEEVNRFDPDHQAFININTRDDLQQAEALARQGT